MCKYLHKLKGIITKSASSCICAFWTVLATRDTWLIPKHKKKFIKYNPQNL